MFIHTYITLRYITLHYIPLHHITLHYITLHYVTSHHITSHYITSHHITSHHITLHYITLHYITLHYIHTYIHTYMSPDSGFLAPPPPVWSPPPHPIPHSTSTKLWRNATFIHFCARHCTETYISTFSTARCCSETHIFILLDEPSRKWKTAPAAHYLGEMCLFIAKAIATTWQLHSDASRGSSFPMGEKSAQNSWNP